MSQIFISYANEDKDAARRLADAFRTEGWSVWWDKHIPPGMDYAQVIEQAVTDARCIVVLWSRHSITSRWVHTEAAVGADRNIIATVIVDDTPGDKVPFEFRRLQAVNLADWQPGDTHAGFASLANRIRSILDEPQQPLPSQPDDASWKDALTAWGTGRQRVYRIAAVVSGLLGIGACSEALDYGDGEMLFGAAFFTAAAVYLLYLGRKPG